MGTGTRGQQLRRWKLWNRAEMSPSSDMVDGCMLTDATNQQSQLRSGLSGRWLQLVENIWTIPFLENFRLPVLFKPMQAIQNPNKRKTFFEKF